MAGEWIHSRDFSMWVNLKTGRVELYDRIGNIIRSEDLKA